MSWNSFCPCGERLYYRDREAFGQEFCLRCAQIRGLTRTSDALRMRNLAAVAAALEPWWRWTVYLDHAIGWDQVKADRRSLGL